MGRYTMISTINKSTSVEKNSATAIDHIIDCQIKTAILKRAVTDHFPIHIALRTD